MKYKLLSIVIPVYNEQDFIETVISRVLTSDISPLKKEIIIVDDASTDKTAQIIKKIALLHPEISLITCEKNNGKGAVLRRGFLKTRGDIVLIQDADLEYNPEEYPLLLEPFLVSDADVVFGSRFISNRPHRVLYFWHYVANVILTTFSNIFTNLNLTDMETGYKVFRGEVIRAVGKKLQSNRFGFEPEVTARIAKIPNIKIFEVGISYAGRTYNEGKKIGWRDAIEAIGAVIKYNLFC